MMFCPWRDDVYKSVLTVAEVLALVELTLVSFYSLTLPVIVLLLPLLTTLVWCTCVLLPCPPSRQSVVVPRVPSFQAFCPSLSCESFLLNIACFFWTLISPALFWICLSLLDCCFPVFTLDCLTICKPYVLYLINITDLHKLCLPCLHLDPLLFLFSQAWKMYHES